MATRELGYRAILLSAGKGSRLLPLTCDRPKCLIEMADRTLLEWQLDCLFAAGIAEMVVVAGFGVELVEQTIDRRGADRGRVSLIFNPFYHVADNLGSAWMARHAMDRDFLLLNGDTLVPPLLIERLAEAPPAPITLAVDVKDRYDSDDMKVLRSDDRVVRVDKGLAEGSYDSESVGLLRFSGNGRSAFRDEVEALIRAPEGTSHFYLRAIDRLADTGIVHAAEIGGLGWTEVDYPADLEKARALTALWTASDLLGDGPVSAEPFA